MSCVVQIYCRRPSLGEAAYLLSIGAGYVGWHVQPTDGDSLVQSRQMVRLIAAAGGISSVLVHSRKPDVLEGIAEMLAPDYLLLSSDRDDSAMPVLANELAPRTRLMMSVPVRPANTDLEIDSLDLARAYAAFAGCLILDTCPDPTLSRFGCTGRTNDWSICRSIVDAVQLPVILAGGLTAENVAAAIATVRPAGVDACTSLEYPDKSKDLEKCRAFVRAVMEAGG